MDGNFCCGAMFLGMGIGVENVEGVSELYLLVRFFFL